MSEGWVGTYLQRTRPAVAVAPVVVQVEADQTQHGDVEENLPARHDAAEAVQPGAPLHEGGCGLVALDGGVEHKLPRALAEQRGHVHQVVAAGQLVGKERANIKNPGGDGNVLARQGGGEVVVDPEDEQHLGCGDAVQGDEEDECKNVVEGEALLLAGLGLVGGGCPGGGRRRGGGRGRVDGVPCLAQERVEEEEEGHVRQVGAEGVVLGIGRVLERRGSVGVLEVAAGLSDGERRTTLRPGIQPGASLLSYWG